MAHGNCAGCGSGNYVVSMTNPQYFSGLQQSSPLYSGVDSLDNKLNNPALNQFSLPTASDYMLNLGGAATQTRYFNPESEQVAQQRTMGRDVYRVAQQIISTANLSYASAGSGSSGGSGGS